MTPRQQTAAGLGLIAVLGYVTGYWLPPEIAAGIMGALA